MEHRKQAPVKNRDTSATIEGLERRFVASDFEIRESGDGKPNKLFGYALRFGSVYDMGWFTEEVDRRALDNSNMDDVRILLNHDVNIILGRTAAGTATVGVDNTGLWYEAELPDSPNGVNARVAIERGDITQSSWGFRLRQDDTGRRTGDKWEMRNGKEHRILTDVAEIFDTSPVTFPANPDTSVAKRSLETSKSETRDGEAPESMAPAPESWDIGWMMENVTWATYRANEMIAALNNCISNYDYYANQGKNSDTIFSTLAESCRAAKAALIANIDAHADAIKALNSSENRTGAATEETEEQANTNTNSDLLLLELQLIEARVNINKRKIRL